MRFVFFYSTFYILVAILDCPNNIIPWIHWLRQKSIIRQKGLKFDPNSQYSSYGIQWLELGASNLGQPKINKKSYHLLFIKDYYTSTTTYTAKKKWAPVQAPDAVFSVKLTNSLGTKAFSQMKTSFSGFEGQIVTF